ncbi:MAG: glutamate--tRNA ligase [Candidatus Sungbacteria bacterium]|nr:glutamate--tRNA ligase [Candidatus Sungbacteria bacterium]
MGVRVRIAPSPTGYLHVGTARAALFNFLFARQNNGAYILRLEDTDVERSKAEYEEKIYESLDWLGLVPDEGPIQGGPFAPYRDSERKDDHRASLHALLAEGNAFFCSHPSDDKDYSVHWCEFRDGGGDSGGIIRFKTPQHRDISFNDLIRGRVTINTDTFGDFSIARNLDSPLYNFAVTVDDEAMRITHVIRGEDHIANTPKQILLQEALGYISPQFGHLPLLLGTDRSKLSKRHGVTSVVEFREQGYLPEALVNFIALLGWNPGDDREIFSLNELISLFSLEKVQKSGAIFDVAKLDWMNSEYIRMLSVSELADRLIPFMEKADLNPRGIGREKLEQVVALEQPRLKTLSEIGERTFYFFKEPMYDKELLRWKGMSDNEVSESLKFSEKIMESRIKNQESRNEIEKIFLRTIGEGDKGKMLWPLRVALTGLRASPGPFDIIAILGVEETLKRVRAAIRFLAK